MVVVAAVVFHRPLLRLAIDFAAKRAVAAQGMALKWDLSGSVTGGLTLDDVEITGPPGAPVRRLNLAHAELHYDLLQGIRTGPGSALQRVVVHGLNADIDATGPEKREPREEKPDRRKRGLPAVRLPEIDLRDIHLTIRQRQGDILVRGLRFSLSESSSGVLEAERVEVPGMEPLTGVRGTTAMTPQSLTLADLTLWAGVEVRRLAVDLARLRETAVPVGLSVRQGGAAVDADAVVSDWDGDFAVRGSLSATNVSAAHLGRWGVPDGGSGWHADRLDLEVDGPVLRPDRLRASLKLTAGRFRTGPVPWDGGELRATIGDARLDIESLDALTGPNQVSATGSIELSGNWAGMTRMNAAAKWSLRAPDAGRLAPEGVAVEGAVSGEGELTLTDGRISQLAARIDAAQVLVAGVPAERLAARVAGDLRRLQFDDVRIGFSPGNALAASGTFEPGVEQRFDVRWDLQCTDLSTLPLDPLRVSPYLPSAGSLSFGGAFSGSVLEMRTGQWDEVNGSATLEAAGIRVQEAALQSLKLEAAAADGTVHVPSLEIHLDDRNSLRAGGSVRLLGEGNFDAAVDTTLPDLSALSPWTALAGGPGITAGGATASWSGSGTWRDGSIQGDGTVRVSALEIEGLPGPVSVAALVRHAGAGIEVPEWNASSGQWRAAGSLAWDGARLQVPAIEAFAGERKLLTGRLSLPLAPGSDGGPLNPDEPVEADVQADRLDIAGLAAALGQSWPVSGVINGSLSATGTLQNPAARLDIDAGGLHLNGSHPASLQPANLSLHAVLADEAVSLNASLHQHPLQPLTVSASMPFSATALAADPDRLAAQPIRASVSLPASSLSFLPELVPELATVKGSVSLNATVTGTLRQPEWRGRFQADVPALALDRASLPSVKDLKLRVSADGYRVTIDQAEVLVAGGRLRLSGGSDLTHPGDPSLNLRLRADQVLAVRDEAVSLRADGDLTCQGTLSQAAVRGSIGLVRGRVFKEVEYLPLSLPNQLPPPPPPVHTASEGPPALPPPLDQWTLDVAIRTRDPVRLMGNVARGGATADLHLGGTGGHPELTGAVDLSDIWVKLPYSRVTFPEAKITFTRDAPFDPRIDIRGESLVGDRQVYINVQGRAVDPMVRLSSSPPLPEGEIAALLATGVTTADLQGSGNEAAGRAAFLLLSDLYRKLFGRDDRGDGDDEPPRLTFDFSLVEGGRTGRNVSAIYELSPRWRTIGRVGESGTFRGLLYYLIRFR